MIEKSLARREFTEKVASHRDAYAGGLNLEATFGLIAGMSRELAAGADEESEIRQVLISEYFEMILPALGHEVELRERFQSLARDLGWRGPTDE